MCHYQMMCHVVYVMYDNSTCASGAGYTFNCPQTGSYVAVSAGFRFSCAMYVNRTVEVMHSIWPHRGPYHCWPRF
jgi:hypothetical protein